MQGPFLYSTHQLTTPVSFFRKYEEQIRAKNLRKVGFKVTMWSIQSYFIKNVMSLYPWRLLRDYCVAHVVKTNLTDCKVELFKYQVKTWTYFSYMSLHWVLSTQHGPLPDATLLSIFCRPWFLPSTEPPLPSGQWNDHPHHQIPQRFPFNCWYENISGQEGRAQAEGIT